MFRYAEDPKLAMQSFLRYVARCLEERSPIDCPEVAAAMLRHLAAGGSLDRRGPRRKPGSNPIDTFGRLAAAVVEHGNIVTASEAIEARTGRDADSIKDEWYTCLRAMRAQMAAEGVSALTAFTRGGGIVLTVDQAKEDDSA